MKLPIYLFLLLFFFKFVKSHPIPDIPVTGSFDENGTATIITEIETRSFSEDPESVPMLEAEIYQKLTDREKKVFLNLADKMIQKSLLIRFNEKGWELPDFSYKFEKKIGGNQMDGTDTFVIRGYCKFQLGAEVKSYQIRAKDSAAYDLIFTNLLNGVPQKRVNVLFPGENSFVLDLEGFFKTNFKNSNTSQKNLSENDLLGTVSTFSSFCRQGFVHVLPLGLDHILFVLGLFFLCRKWKPILYQVSVFTIAHTITLGLATLELVSAPSHVVEPIIAASIAVVAIENILFPGYRHTRLFVVFFFGLIHGLGFAGALSAFNLEPTSLVIGLLGFNVGVELGQLAVISIVFISTFWIKAEFTYRKLVVIPGSSLIALMGIYWTIERVFF